VLLALPKRLAARFPDAQRSLRRQPAVESSDPPAGP